jgi:hypothetical protein
MILLICLQNLFLSIFKATPIFSSNDPNIILLVKIPLRGRIDEVYQRKKKRLRTGLKFLVQSWALQVMVSNSERGKRPVVVGSCFDGELRTEEVANISALAFREKHH